MVVKSWLILTAKIERELDQLYLTRMFALITWSYCTDDVLPRGLGRPSVSLILVRKSPGIADAHTREGMRAAQALVDRGIAEWRGGKPTIKLLRPRKGSAYMADAVLEDRR